jgi:hypothetical protein
MDRQGNLSNEAAPTVLYHYSYLFDEEGLIFRKLKWKNPVNPDFIKYCNSDWVNVAILSPEDKEKEVIRLTTNYPFRHIYTYKDMLDIKKLSFEEWHKFIAYYDDDGARGSWFRGRWKT